MTWQANSGSRQFHELLDRDPPIVEEFRLELATEQLLEAGFHFDESGMGQSTTAFADIGALAWYLSNVPWAVPGFTIDGYRDELLRLHGRPIPVASSRFWLRAHK
ncbi:MAG: methyltransferase domain protein [Acidimicrobiaceae bacterium]|nr:methyltransferase domain protein [Acidimicrobiaceae bacterium]